jgi:hypothetical protein
MTPLPIRYHLLLLILLLLALVPVAIHFAGRFQFDDCAEPSALFDTFRIAGSQPGEETRNTGGRRVIQSSGGTVPVNVPRISPLQFRIVRSFDPRKLHYWPIPLLDEIHYSSRVKLRWLEIGGEKLPVRIYHDHTMTSVRFLEYMYVYESRPRRHPFWAGLASAFLHPLDGARPLTLFMVSGTAPADLLEVAEQSADEWLISAWRYYKMVCSERP